MAQNTTYTTGTSANIWEDVENAIQTTSPHSTPFISSIGKRKITNTKHEWLEDELRGAADNAAVEGAAATFAEQNQPTRQENYAQIFQDTFQLSGTMDAVDLIGRKSESTRLMAKHLKSIATDMEKAFINSTASVAGNASTARKAKGLDGFVVSNDASFASYAAGNVFSEAKLMEMSKAVFSNSDVDRHNLLVPANQAAVIAAWDQNSRITVNQSADAKKLTMAVMELITPFGVIKVVIDRYIDAHTESTTDYDSVYLYAPEKLQVGWLRHMKTTELAKDGDSRKFQTVGEATLICHSEKAAAKCKKLAQ
jgi:hypothetical protein